MTARTVWLASYPKSGNTWIRALLSALEQGDALDINRIGHAAMPVGHLLLQQWIGMPSSDFTTAELAQLRPLLDADLNATVERACFRKIHDALMFEGRPIVPPEATLGAIYIVRDPRAVAVSFSHHFEQNLERTVGLMADPSCTLLPDRVHNEAQLPQHLGTWTSHVRGWLEHDLFPVLRVRYEDLHADPAGELARIVEFVGLEVSDEAITLAAQAAAFERLSGQEASSAFRERFSQNARFFRRGEVESWREELPEPLARQIEADHAETMAWLGYAPSPVLV